MNYLDLLAWSPPGWGRNLFYGALSTLEISALAYGLGLILGLFGATGKLSGGKALKRALEVYTTVVRSVPELLLIVILFYTGTQGINALAESVGIGRIEINGFVAAVMVLGVVQGAYSTEVLRGAIQAIPIGQIEAAKAYGMAPFLMFRRITLPAMLPFALPGITMGPGLAQGGRNYANTAFDDPRIYHESRLGLSTTGKESCKHWNTVARLLLEGHHTIGLGAQKLAMFSRGLKPTWVYDGNYYEPWSLRLR